jgi:hypothetical protein
MAMIIGATELIGMLQTVYVSMQVRPSTLKPGFTAIQRV